MKIIMDPLEEKIIKNGLHPFFHTVEILSKVDSTNSNLKQRGETLKEGYVLLSNQQSSGKGRNGRTFFSPPNKGLYLSFLVKPSIGIKHSLSLPAIACVAVCEAIKNICHVQPSIKWVNDLFLADKKIGGILCESVLKANSNEIEYMIIGIGLNVHKQTFPYELKPIAASIETSDDFTIERSVLAREILNQFQHFYTDNSKSYLQYYRTHSYILNTKIQITQNQKTYIATAIDIDEFGQLLVEDINGCRTLLNSGEIHTIKIPPKHLL